MSTSVSELRVGALEFAVGLAEVAGLATFADGRRERFSVGRSADLIPRIDALRAELRNPTAVASGRVPRLREFAASWGRSFLPAALLRDAPDVLVVVPHGPTHDLPLQLVEVEVEGDGGGPLGTRVGISFTSSRSLFLRAVSRNPARGLDLARWRFDGEHPAEGAPAERSFSGGAVDVLGNQDEAFLELCQSVAAHFAPRAKVFGGAEFSYSRTAAKAAFRGPEPPSVVCSVAHGWVDAANPRRSGLLVARDRLGLILRSIPLHGGRYFDFRDLPLCHLPVQLKPATETEILTAGELEIDAEAGCELALLLGCSAGWGRVLQGDEPASLAETWLKIGAVSAAAPMWDSPIEAVRGWVEHFLPAWVRLGLPKALAMRYAMRRLHEGPFHDAPERLGVMTLRGDWL